MGKDYRQYTDFKLKGIAAIKKNLICDAVIQYMKLEVFSKYYQKRLQK